MAEQLNRKCPQEQDFTTFIPLHRLYPFKLSAHFPPNLEILLIYYISLPGSRDHFAYVVTSQDIQMTQHDSTTSTSFRWTLTLCSNGHGKVFKWSDDIAKSLIVNWCFVWWRLQVGMARSCQHDGAILPALWVQVPARDGSSTGLPRQCRRDHSCPGDTQAHRSVQYVTFIIDEIIVHVCL